MQDKTSGISNIMVPPKSDEPGLDECAGQMIPKMIQVKFRSQHSDQVVAASGQKRSSPEESCAMDTDDTGVERAARRARLALVEQVVLLLHRTPEQDESNATHDDTCVDPELIIREEEWVKQKMDEGNLDPKLVAVATKVRDRQ